MLSQPASTVDNEGAVPSDDGGRFDLLACASCGSVDLVADAARSKVTCSSCKADYSFTDEIVDFVADRVRTELDNIDYDAFYDVESTFDQNFQSLNTAANEYTSRIRGTVLEIGAGTGGMTVGLLNNCPIEEFVITDVSKAMLKKCRHRLDSKSLLDKADCVFATNDGTNFCVPNESFDAVIGYFVVHHVLDYSKLLQAAYAALRPGGTALFVEPNRAYYQAVLEAAGPVIAKRLRRRRSRHSKDLVQMIDFLRYAHFGIKYAGDREALAPLEDKHMFARNEFEREAAEAGFSETHTLPFGLGDSPVAPLQVLGRQIGIGTRFLDKFCAEVSRNLSPLLSALPKAETTPSMVFALRKTEGHSGSVQGHQIPDTADDIDFRTDLRITADVSDDVKALTIEGWVVTRQTVQKIVLEVGAQRWSVPVGLARIDVFRALRKIEAYSTYHLLYSGLSSSFQLPAASANAELAIDLKVNVFAELADGRALCVANGLTFDDGVARMTTVT